jgi:EmrB/QacA subfamily drug resistance transporter
VGGWAVTRSIVAARQAYVEEWTIRTNSAAEQARAEPTITAGSGRVVPSWVLLALVCLGQFMVVLDISIVNVALPSIQAELGFTASGLQWVVNAYTLTFAGFLLLGGRAADLFGRRRMFLAGLGMFTAASFVGGLAQSQSMLLVARALQGLGGAVLAPATLTILTTTFPEGPARARALGVWSAVAGAGASAGALLGGLLTELISWRWILFVNVPVGVLALIAAKGFLPESRADAAHRQLDVAGALTVTGGLVALVFAIVRTQSYAWTSSQTLIPLGVAVVLLGTFLLIETRIARSPLVPLRIFRSRSVAGGNAFMVLLFAAMFGAWYFQTLYMQRILGFSPLQAGLAFLPQTLLIAVGAQVTSRLVTRVGSRPLLLAGTLITAVGLAWLGRITPLSTFSSDLLGPFVLIGLGLGLLVTPVTVAATAGVPREDAGLASGLLNSGRSIGASIGLAVLATVAANRTTGLLERAGSTPSSVAAAITGGYARAIEIGVIILLVAGVVAALAIPPLRRSSVSRAEPLGEMDATPEPVPVANQEARRGD